MAKRAVLQPKLIQLGKHCLVFACLASVVVFDEDRLARCYASREMTAALSTINVVIVDTLVAVLLWACYLRLRHVYGWPTRKQLYRKRFVLLAFSLCNLWEPFKFHKCFGTLSEAFVEVTS